MQFILITKHKHMYINSRIIQTKQKRFFPFLPFLFFFFVNRYDIIRILIAESYKQNKKDFSLSFPFFSFFVNRYDIIRILIAESYKKSCFPFFPLFLPFSLVNRYDIICHIYQGRP